VLPRSTYIYAYIPFSCKQGGWLHWPYSTSQQHRFPLDTWPARPPAEMSCPTSNIMIYCSLLFIMFLIFLFFPFSIFLPPAEVSCPTSNIMIYYHHRDRGGGGGEREREGEGEKERELQTPVYIQFLSLQPGDRYFGHHI
jgi:hypothetical protein